MSLFSRKILLRLGTVLTIALLAVPIQAAPFPIESVLDDLVASLCEGRSYDELASLDNAAILSTLTAEQREILSTAYWGFDVDIPVTVSVMRDIQQEIVPFWLTESGFEKTGGIVKNEVYTYEVWQKEMPAGHIGLGINGFDRHRPHYFVGVGGQQAKDNLTISNVMPVLHKQQKIHPFALGSSMYLDWSELVVTEMPESLEGHRLLTTIRGRAREAHLINAFRKTAYPSSETPDMTVLTWSDNPQNTQTIQWRTSPSSKSPYQIYYRKKDDHSAPAWDAAEASRVTLTDRNIINNTSVLWYTSTLTGLSAGTCYEYVVAPTGKTPGTVTGEFRTAPA
ncbi:MAG: fibronectin type III domain-containing protein, partial [Candidatus Hydrogenedentes bacterium]|nr:fibronectin type III domain-containing protein [Candidatus Hydrogenedentota bacterium]